ncbi:rhodanese-like domain-containing protein [Microbacterium sp. 1P10UB]|uniref:rhodanese-like domain-containing protein n=1 Tax=unclassified Microbacterium TaxID=2609290 RepID=UPI0039A10D4C
MTTDLPTSGAVANPTVDAAAYFSAKLACETDPSDVYEAQETGERFILVDVRGSDAWAQGRIPGAVHIPYREIAERAALDIPLDMPVVVYCWSPGCNAGAKGALAFAHAGYAVREMIGGFEYWAREGYPTEDADGALPRTRDRLVALVR